jgi:SRSO17 transposase
VTLVDERLYLPKKWCDDAQRCDLAGIPEEHQCFKTKVALALEMIAHQRRIGVRFSWVGADGFYGNDPAFLRGIDAMSEVFVADVHCNQLIFLEDPKPTLKERKGTRGRKPTKLEANAPAIRVDQWQSDQPEDEWKPFKVRDSSRGELEVEVLHRRVWLWDNEETAAHCWHLIVRREINAPGEIKYTLSNAPAETGVKRLAEMQAQRYWVERAFQDGKSECGMADYQVRKWSAWHHHMALVFMAMLFMLEERIQAEDTHPLLSCSDIEELLKQFLPKRAVTQEEVFAQMEKRHKKRLASIRSHYAKQGIDQLE